MTKILVIDDEESIRKMIVTVLRKNDFEVFSAVNGNEGIELARTKLPDLIVCDVRMELVNGYEMLTAIRNDPMTTSIPFILITAQPDRQGMRQGMELGADDYLTKPFTPAELLAAVGSRLRKHQAVVHQAESKLEELRSRMSMTLPHELRTPLNGMLGFADILRKQYASIEPAEVGRMAERIYRNGKRLHRLIENFLLYAQIELLGTDLRKKETLQTGLTKDVDRVVEIVATTKAEEGNRSKDLSMKLIHGSVPIASQYFMKIIEELFDNAMRFSKNGTPIQVSLKNTDDSIALSITDHGRGMNREQIANIGAYVQFERKFYEQQGSGLGLTVAKRLAEVHGGSLEILSEYGKWTTVTVNLPRVETIESIGAPNS